MSDHDDLGSGPERYLSGEGDSNQLPREDTLIDRGVDDILDEGYSPPDYPRGNHYGETPLEEIKRETLDQRLSEEEPDVWAADRLRRRDGREPDRAGRIVESDDTWRHQDLYASDAGVAGGAATAEEAAMHVFDPDERDDEDVSDPVGDDGEFPETDSDEER